MPTNNNNVQSPTVARGLTHAFPANHAPKTSGIIYASETGARHHANASLDGNGHATFQTGVKM